MKQILIILFTGILIQSCSSSKIGQEKVRYFNQDDIEISKSKFDRIRLKNRLKLVDGVNDSLTKKKLVKRENYGKITNKELFRKSLEKELNTKISDTNPIVIIYHNDISSYNSAGEFVEKQWMKKWKNDLENRLKQIAEIKPIYLYKKFNGLKMHKEIIPWQEDPDNRVSKLFFKYNYGWLSFVVISKNGNYISYFDEFTLDYVLLATELMNK